MSFEAWRFALSGVTVVVLSLTYFVFWFQAYFYDFKTRNPPSCATYDIQVKIRSREQFLFPILIVINLLLIILDIVFEEEC